MPTSIVIITGHSGSGKSTAISVLEDQGYLCIDNMPIDLIERLLLMDRKTDKHDRIALVIDVRQLNKLKDVGDMIKRLRKSINNIYVLYLKASESVLIRRYSETRRKHPLDKGQGLRPCILEEKKILQPLLELANDTINTDYMAPHELRKRVIRHIENKTLGYDLSITLLSFGFKYGIPLDADMVFDVRFLSNPYFVETLNKKTGLDKEVREYIFKHEDSTLFLQMTYDYILFLLPKFEQEGKSYLTIAVGCTGGQHRSISTVYELERKLHKNNIKIYSYHRDL